MTNHNLPAIAVLAVNTPELAAALREAIQDVVIEIRVCQTLGELGTVLDTVAPEVLARRHAPPIVFAQLPDREPDLLHLYAHYAAPLFCAPIVGEAVPRNDFGHIVFRAPFDFTLEWNRETNRDEFTRGLSRIMRLVLKELGKERMDWTPYRERRIYNM